MHAHNALTHTRTDRTFDNSKHTLNTHTCSHTHTCTHPHRHTHIYTYTHTHKQTQLHTTFDKHQQHTHAHTHAHTHTYPAVLAFLFDAEETTVEPNENFNTLATPSLLADLDAQSSCQVGGEPAGFKLFTRWVGGAGRGGAGRGGAGQGRAGLGRWTGVSWCFSGFRRLECSVVGDGRVGPSDW